MRAVKLKQNSEVQIKTDPSWKTMGLNGEKNDINLCFIYNK